MEAEGRNVSPNDHEGEFSIPLAEGRWDFHSHLWYKWPNQWALDHPPWNCGNYTGRRPVESENSPGVVGITRAGVEAEGRNVGPSDAHHEGRILRFHGL